MNKLTISGVTKGQYKQLCPLSWKKCNNDHTLLNFKIRRAVKLGKHVHTYSNGCKIIRYHSHNFLISDGEVMTMWTDISREPHTVSEASKQMYQKPYYSREIFIQRPLGSDLTKAGFNKSLKIAQGCSVEKLIGYGFTNYRESTLFYSEDLGGGISFNFAIDKATGEIIRVDVLDEDFCQPYDYQSIILEGRGTSSVKRLAKEIYFKVNGILSKMQNTGIIEGFEAGMYV